MNFYPSLVLQFFPLKRVKLMWREKVAASARRKLRAKRKSVALANHQFPPAPRTRRLFTGHAVLRSQPWLCRASIPCESEAVRT